MAEGHKLVVDLGADAVAAEKRMYLESEIKGRTSRRHSLYLTLGRENKYLGSEQVQLYGIEEIHGIGLRVVENLLYRAQPIVQFAVVLGYFLALLVLPVGGKALLGNLVHTVGADLHLYPPSLLAHQRYVQGLVAVGLGMVDPIAQAVGVRLVNLAYRHVNVEALVHLLFTLLRLEDNPHGQDVIYLVERYVLVLHLVPNGIRAFHTRLDFILQPHLVENLADGGGETCEQRVAPFLRAGQLVLDSLVLLGMLELETKVLKLGLYLIKPQPVGQRRIDVQCLASYLILFVGRLAVQGAHVVQAVAYLDEDHADVVAHGKEQLLEVLGLGRSLLAEDSA